MSDSDWANIPGTPAKACRAANLAMLLAQPARGNPAETAQPTPNAPPSADSG